jgi:hypothetical protein
MLRRRRGERACIFDSMKLIKTNLGSPQPLTPPSPRKSAGRGSETPPVLMEYSTAAVHSHSPFLQRGVGGVRGQQPPPGALNPFPRAKPP